MNKMIKMLVLAAVGAVASLAQAQEGIANNSELAQVLVKPPAYKITYANSQTIVTNDWMVFVWVKHNNYQNRAVADLVNNYNENS